MSIPQLLNQFGLSTTLQGRLVRLSPVFVAATLAACQTMPERVVDSCMQRGESRYFLGIGYQARDQYNKECDEGRDVAMIASAPTANGGKDYMASLIAMSTVARKNPDIKKHYEEQLKLRGLTHQQVLAAAEKLQREAESGVLMACKPTENPNDEDCSYVAAPKPAASAPAAGASAPQAPARK